MTLTLLSLHILDFSNKWSCSHLTFSSVSNLLSHVWFMAKISTPPKVGASPEWGSPKTSLGIWQSELQTARIFKHLDLLVKVQSCDYAMTHFPLLSYPSLKMHTYPMHYDCHNYEFPWTPSSQNNKTVIMCKSFSKWGYFVLKFTTNMKVYSITLQNEMAVDNTFKETHSVNFQSIIHLSTVHLSSEAVCWLIVYFVQL